MGCNCTSSKADRQAKAAEAQQVAEARRARLAETRQTVAETRRADRDARYAKLGIK